MSATQDVLSNYQHVIESYELITGSKGVYEFSVDGTVLYSKHEQRRHANDGELLELFTTHMGPEVPRYGNDDHSST